VDENPPLSSYEPNPAEGDPSTCPSTEQPLRFRARRSLVFDRRDTRSVSRKMNQYSSGQLTEASCGTIVARHARLTRNTANHRAAYTVPRMPHAGTNSQHHPQVDRPVGDFVEAAPLSRELSQTTCQRSKPRTERRRREDPGGKSAKDKETAPRTIFPHRDDASRVTRLRDSRALRGAGKRERRRGRRSAGLAGSAD